MRVGQRVGPFDIENELGSGAMGSVYLARHRDTRKLVAIKVMLAGSGGNKTALARFQREAAVLKQLHHPNIVRFYAAGDFDGAPFYAMEYIRGEPLDHMLQRGGRLTWEKVVEIGKQVCAALKHAHDQGVVHRDLKPSNLMVLPDGTIKLTDFGIAKDLDVTQLTSANCTVGTAAYMSPEQCKGERNLTHKSDLYSFGIVMYELLVGRKPFQAETTMDMFLQHVQGTFERPCKIVLDIPIWLDNVVCQLLEKKPEHRPFDAGVVAEALDKVAEKVAAQQSAGVERAKARLVDRSGRDQPVDESDRKAAATLRRGRSRKKKRGKPFYQSVWFQLIGISALLLAVGSILYQVFRPPPADLLFKQARDKVESGDYEAMKEARNGPIAEFLSRYGQGNDERIAQVRNWADEIDVRVKDSQLLNRRRLFQSDHRGEEIFRSALSYEEAGELKNARDKWEELLALEESDELKGDELRIFHIIAARRIRIVDDAIHREQEVIRSAAQIAESDRMIEIDDELERLATEALRFADFKDIGMARVRWADLKMKTEKRLDKRAWALIAYKHIKGLKDETFEDGQRQGIVKAKLDQAIELASGRTKEARALFKEIVTLYKSDSDEDIAKLVTDARKRYEDLVKAESG